MHQEHNNRATQNKLKQLKPRFGRLLRPLAWNCSMLLYCSLSPVYLFLYDQFSGQVQRSDRCVCAW